jgi:hypothetical protein
MSPEVSQPPSIRRAVLVAALISLLVTAIRLYGEQHDWNAFLFNKAPGGGGSPLGITWLTIPFGFWFGRRLAQNRNLPRSTGKALLFPLLGVALAFGVFKAVPLVIDDLRQSFVVTSILVALCGLFTFAAWRRAWFVLVCFGILARIPVILVQYESLRRGWNNHFASLPPTVPPEDALFVLTMAQCTFWPLAFTPLVGGLFAALGALTVRRS